MARWTLATRRFAAGLICFGAPVQMGSSGRTRAIVRAEAMTLRTSRHKIISAPSLTLIENIAAIDANICVNADAIKPTYQFARAATRSCPRFIKRHGFQHLFRAHQRQRTRGLIAAHRADAPQLGQRRSVWPHAGCGNGLGPAPAWPP